jgi:hypothetical protein
MFLAAAIWLTASFTSSKIAAASASGAAICDAAADHFLIIENYPETIRLHREVLKTQPENSLAYYHLGFPTECWTIRRTKSGRTGRQSRSD